MRCVILKRSKKRNKKWLKIILIIVLLLGLAIGGYVLFFYNHAKSTVNKKMHNPVETIDTAVTKKKVRASEPLNILLLGIDAKEGEAGRSDAIMIMRLKPDEDAMTIVSIPRDARTKMVGEGYGYDDKINHAYAFGKDEMAVATVENFLDIELDYYVSITMKGLIELVDELGTITVDNEVAWSDSRYDFPLGRIEMDGDKTLAFVRMRKQDSQGDFGRTKRHRKVIEGILREGASIGSIPKFSSMITVLGNNMDTNMDFDDIKKLFSGYKDTRRHIDEHMMRGTGKLMPNRQGSNSYYLIVPDDEIQKAHELLTAP